MNYEEPPERINFSIKGVPKEWFETQFKPSVFKNFNDTYVLKIMHDHEVAAAFAPRLEKISSEIEELKMIVLALKK